MFEITKYFLLLICFSFYKIRKASEHQTLELHSLAQIYCSWVRTNPKKKIYNKGLNVETNAKSQLHIFSKLYFITLVGDNMSFLNDLDFYF